MRSALRRCVPCGRYTLEERCPDCGSLSATVLPPRYSPDDRYGEYRRRCIREEYGENGKCDQIHR